MVDKSINISVLKQLVLCGRAVVGGKLVTTFLKVIDLHNRKACTITTALTAYLESVELNIDLKSSFGSDGASVMIGHRYGVAARLCDLNEQIIAEAVMR